jgi:predicted RNase H-like HicB family nuclease
VKAYDFKVILEPDETGGYVVTCPSLAGCYSQGNTVEEALANIKEAIELCLEDMRDQGELIPDPSPKPLTVPDHSTLKPGLLRKLIRDARLDVEEFTRLL